MISLSRRLKDETDLRRKIKMVHIAVCDNKFNVLEKIKDGKKTMLIRGADGRKLPHSRVFVDDELYFFEKNSKAINYKARVLDVHNYTKLTNQEIDKILEDNKDKLALENKQQEKYKKKCLCLIEFDSFEEIDSIDFQLSRNTEDWVMAESLEELQK